VIRGEVIEDEKEIFVVGCFKKQKRTEKSKKRAKSCQFGENIQPPRDI